MSSRPRLTDSMVGLLIAGALVATACWVIVTIDRHVKEHGHCSPYSTLSVERAERDQGDAGRKRQDVRHGCILSRGTGQEYVRGGHP